MNEETSKIDAAMFIAFSTALCYAMAYTFEVMYQEYYHLPRQFVEMNITTLTKTLVPIAMALFSIWWLFDGIFRKVSSFINFTAPITIGLVSALLIAGTSYLGSVAPKFKEEYFVIRQGNTLYVSVTTVKDSMIVAPLDIEKETIKPVFKVIETKNLKDGETVRFKDGLKVEEIKNSQDFQESLK